LLSAELALPGANLTLYGAELPLLAPELPLLAPELVYRFPQRYHLIEDLLIADHILAATVPEPEHLLAGTAVPARRRDVSRGPRHRGAVAVDEHDVVQVVFLLCSPVNRRTLGRRLGTDPRGDRMEPNAVRVSGWALNGAVDRKVNGCRARGHAQRRDRENRSADDDRGDDTRSRGAG
jgi:hypothetical protein